METFRQITEALTEKYNNAVDFYHKANFDNFFMNIRVATEYVCKAIIFDVLQYEETANKILDGKKRITYNTGACKYEIKDLSNGCVPQNAKLLIPVVAIKSSAPTNAKVHLNISNTEK